MRVLMLNAFHWLKGGVERTLFDETRWLEAAGHEVAHFATADARNRPSPFARHFAPARDFGEDTPAWRQLPQLTGAVWSAPAARALAGLLAEWRPDVAHVHAPSRYLTPAVIAELERAGIPTVMTLHDFKPWCTNRLLYAHGAPCERCRGGAHWHAAITGCVPEVFSLLGWASVDAARVTDRCFLFVPQRRRDQSSDGQTIVVDPWNGNAPAYAVASRFFDGFDARPESITAGHDWTNLPGAIAAGAVLHVIRVTPPALVLEAYAVFPGIKNTPVPSILAYVDALVPEK